MSIEIRCTPYSQSAEIQIIINSSIDISSQYENKIVVEIGELGYLSDYTKQRISYGAKINKDGTNTVNVNFSFICYPLYSETQYEINAYFLTDYIIDPYGAEFTYENAHSNFSTGVTITEGKQNQRAKEIPLSDKQINAKYLYNKIVKTNKMSLESFCCLLGVMDCAGNLNPTADMCFGSFDGENQENDYHPNFTYNFANAFVSFWTGHFPDNYEYHNAYIVLGESPNWKIKQNGISSIYNKEYLSDLIYYNFPSYWYYNQCDDLRGASYNYDPTWGTEYKRAKAFTCLPFFHRDYCFYLYTALTGNEDNNDLNLFRRHEWLTIETVGELISYLVQSTASDIYSDWWITSGTSFLDMYNRYPTVGKFAKCKSTNIERNAEFVFNCFRGGKFGTFTFNTVLYFQHQRVVHSLYNLECVKKKARYWYNYFKKRRHPWWVYIKWNI